MTTTTHAISNRDERLLCSLAHGNPFVHFSLTEFGAEGVTCTGCLTNLELKRARMAEVAARQTQRGPSILDQIKADMLRRNPRLAEPEWAVEDHRPLRNRR